MFVNHVVLDTPYLKIHHISYQIKCIAVLTSNDFSMQEKQQGLIGINIFIYEFLPFTNTTEDITATERAQAFYLRWYAQSSSHSVHICFMHWWSTLVERILLKPINGDECSTKSKWQTTWLLWGMKKRSLQDRAVCMKDCIASSLSKILLSLSLVPNSSQLSWNLKVLCITILFIHLRTSCFVLAVYRYMCKSTTVEPFSLFNCSRFV